MALTSSTPIELSDIQNEFSATSLVGASNAAGLSLPTGMLEFLGLSSSVTITAAPSIIFGDAGDPPSPTGWVNLKSLENRLSFSTGVFANTPTTTASQEAVRIRSFFATNSAGWEVIPTNATLNFVRFSTITAGCCSGGTTTMAPLHGWLEDFGVGGSFTHLGDRTGFLSVSNNFSPITANFTVSSNDLPFDFISRWNSGNIGLSLSGTSSNPDDNFVKRNSDHSVELRIYRILAEINYSL